MDVVMEITEGNCLDDDDDDDDDCILLRFFMDMLQLIICFPPGICLSVVF